MTLVLPYGPEQIGNSSIYSRSARNSNMPCVFDGESIDFESALLTAEWNSDISDYDTPADDFSSKAPSDGLDLKRKIFANDTEAHPTQTKKLRTDDAEDSQADSLKPEVVSPSSSPSSSSSSSSSSSDSHEDDASSPTEADDEDYIPRRRGPQMWNSRQRWKDERKRVLKLSISKLAEIEDPELCMHRSVVINNTVKRLHLDIKNERQAKLQAKLRHRQQRMDFFVERFHPITTAEQFSSNYDSPKTSRSSDLYDDSSCDEIFGVSEDFLRVTIPDRRVSSPIPTNPTNQTNSPDSDVETPMDTSEESTVQNRTDAQTTCYANKTDDSTSSLRDTAVETSASSQFGHRRPTANASNDSTSISNNSTNSINKSNDSSDSVKSMSNSSTSNSSRRMVSNAGSQCATQYRTTRDAVSDGSFPPRVPILDSVVYHSLLASLESS